MHIRAETFDDLLRDVMEAVLNHGSPISPTKGKARELFGVLLQLDNPRARLSRTENRGNLFSALGELLWYLGKGNRCEVIDYYIPGYGKANSDDGETIHGAYGPRLFGLDGVDQLANVIDLLKRKSDTRRAVIQIIGAGDIAVHYKDIPCTCTLQFALRDGQLHMLTSMRSNDVFLGLVHDVFAFTMLQEIVARAVGVEIGVYNHAVGSLHLYDKHEKGAKIFLEEGWQETTAAMPAMPANDPWPAIAIVLSLEQAIRQGTANLLDFSTLDSYWQDIIRLLQAYRAYVNRQEFELLKIKQEISNNIYEPYIDKKLTELRSKIYAGSLEIR